MNEERVRTLRAVLDRIIPRDQDPGAIDLGVDRYVITQLATDSKAAAETIEVGLTDLTDAAQKSGGDFAGLAPATQDKLLATQEKSRWFKLLCELAAEGFYADPGNGGNAGARSWQMIGYAHRMPEGPDGPMPGDAGIRHSSRAHGAPDTATSAKD